MMAPLAAVSLVNALTFTHLTAISIHQTMMKAVFSAM